MERKLSSERLYYLGDYKNIKFSNEVSGIPDEVTKNEKVMELLHKQSYLFCELAYRQYVQMIDDINEKFTTTVNGRRVTDSGAVMDYLQTERTQTLQNLLEEIKNIYMPQEVPQKETN